MRINQECIRDILLFVESRITPSVSSTDIKELVENLSYNEDIISYHVNLISQSKLIEGISYADDIAIDIPDLSPLGRQYLDTIRDDTKWNKLKSSFSSFLSMSIPVALEFALSKL
ncbi:DUF2513 domain-containing protein [Clostridioides difficile]|uniref:DUF2513 domain-containing protein n=1 Tax=Clostridioides difficile TaxID=1496 RepID=UPI000D1D6830|nr:DUF2513 domain-containing protein [Clostridioides difficile]MCI0936227.1 DUF2513 domain-containing protein [Clostridioides difficile]MCI2336649.1 DUF2513 domain-containing protein [Clostridioides difficile]MCZ1034507.1 DUF2513 domain-containing protein [Clostridioides difficile]TKY95343.1 DUF2513 domain-containing protein [Clostridioides difficile]